MVANIYNIISGWISLVWIYKIQILGSLFVTLTIFEYFYRIYLKPIRQKQLHELKKIFSELKQGRLVMKDMTKNELEHELLSKEIGNLADKIDSDNKLITSQMNANQRVLITQFNAEFEVLNIRFNESDGKIDGALSKIQVLEKDTDFIRAIKRYKIFVGAAFASMIAVTGIDELRVWLSKLLPWN